MNKVLSPSISVFCISIMPPILHILSFIYYSQYMKLAGDHGSTVVKVLCYKSEGRFFDPSWCQWIFH